MLCVRRRTVGDVGPYKMRMFFALSGQGWIPWRCALGGGRQVASPTGTRIQNAKQNFLQCLHPEPPSEREGDHEVVEGACESGVLMIGSALFI